MLQHYEQELRFLRELGGEFARKFPKVAARLGIRELANDDPHLERLFQGFAFLAGTVRERLDAEFPAFTEALLEQVYSHPLKPTPSIAVVQFHPNAGDASLADGFTLPSGTELRARSAYAGGAVCQYRTAHPVELWPIAIESLEYTGVLRGIADVRVPSREPIRALLRIGLKVIGGRGFNELRLRSLPLYVGGGDDKSARLYEALVADAGMLLLRWGPRPAEHVAFGDESPATKQCGFDADQALFPAVPAALRGYRLLHEYFAFPTRFHFVELRGLGPGVTRCTSDKLEVILPLRRYDPELEGKLELDRLQLFASPVVNLFSRRCDVAAVRGRSDVVKLVPDRTQPLDFEVHSVTRVAAYLTGQDAPIEYRPLQTLHGRLEVDRQTPHYATERRRHPVPQEAAAGAARAGYAGSEVLLKLIEPGGQGARFEAKQLVVEALCTNRDLPVQLVRDRSIHFALSSGGPVNGVSCLARPSPPRCPEVDGNMAWRLISHLNVSYLSLSEVTGGSAALRELLALYAGAGDPLFRREVDGIRRVESSAIIGPYPQPGPRTFVRGLEITLHCEEQAFAQGAMALASVLSIFFAKHVNAHGFVQTVLHTAERGIVYRMPALSGTRNAL